MREFNLIAPGNKAEVLALLAQGDDGNRIIAGGTGLINLMKQQLVTPDQLISLHKVSDLGAIELSADAVIIGALNRLADIEKDTRISELFPVLIETLREVASPRIRSMATIGGALAHGDPNQDTTVTLTALNCVVVIESTTGTREVPIDQFYKDYYETVLQPTEMVVAVKIPLPADTEHFVFKKFTPASAEDYACVSVCVCLNLKGDRCESCRIVLGGVGSTIIRCKEAERIINDARSLNKRVFENLADDAAIAAAAETDPMDDTRGSSDYKRQMARVWVKRCILMAADQRPGQ